MSWALVRRGRDPGTPELLPGKQPSFPSGGLTSCSPRMLESLLPRFSKRGNVSPAWKCHLVPACRQVHIGIVKMFHYYLLFRCEAGSVAGYFLCFPEFEEEQIGAFSSHHVAGKVGGEEASGTYLPMMANRRWCFRPWAPGHFPV